MEEENERELREWKDFKWNGTGGKERKEERNWVDEETKSAWVVRRIYTWIYTCTGDQLSLEQPLKC